MEKDAAGLQELLSGRYRVDGELGRGGFATVYRVWNPRLGRAEALKVLAPGHQADEDFPRRFMQEVRLAASLEHPSIVKVYDFGEAPGIYWYSMQLVDGRTLSSRLRQEGALAEPEAARIAMPLLDALAYSHSRGIVHRDIKPENVILDGEGRPYLMDFGIAKAPESIVKTQTGFLMGTPAYVSPEQAQAKPLDGRTDLYALGVTLYKAVSGRYPFEASEPLQAVILRLTQPPRPLVEALPDVDPAFAAVVMKALEREPAKRWESAPAMREAFAGFLGIRPPMSATARLPEAVEARETATAMATVAPDAPDAAVLGVAPPSTVLTPVRPERRSITSPLGAPSRRSFILPVAAAVVAVLLALGATALVFLRKGRPGVAVPRAPRAAAVPTRAGPTPRPAATFAAASFQPAPPATTAAAPTPAPLRVTRPTRTPEPEAPVSGRPVTLPERQTPDPPFAGPPPAGCSGAAVTVGFAVDPDGNVVSPRLFPSGAAPECGRYVLEALPRWRWKPAVDAAGVPVPSARLVVLVQLP